METNHTEMTEPEWRQMVKSWGRKEMLKLTRRWGFAAHRLNDDQLVEALWQLKRRNDLYRKYGQQTKKEGQENAT